MTQGKALPSSRDDLYRALGGPTGSLSHPITLIDVLKCKDCGRSLSSDELNDREFILRLAKSAVSARAQPGEDLSRLTDDEFIARLFGTTHV